MSTIEFRHVGIVIKNIDKQLFFYRDLLGLEIISSEVEKGSFIDSLIGEKDLAPSIYKLGKNGNIILELLHFGFDVRCPNFHKSLLHTGITHFCLAVDQIEILYKKLCDHGIEFISSPSISQNGRFKVCFCKDFENNYLELVEVL